MAESQAPLSIKDIREFFGGYKTLKDFSADWRSLTEQDRKEIRSGLENGTLTY